MGTEPTDIVEIVYCYAPQDEQLKDELDKQLAILKRMGLIKTWCDQDIDLGKDKKSEVEQHLNEAHIILLLVSPDFIASDYHYQVEMVRALERHNRKEARVILILLRPIESWRGVVPGDIQALPKNGIPVTVWSYRDSAFLSIVEDIKKVVNELSPSQSMNPFQRFKEQGDAYLKDGKYVEAVEAYDQALVIDPKDVSVHKSKGLALFHLQLYDAALIVFKQAIGLDSNDASLYESKGDVLYELKRYDEALESYDVAIGLKPLNAQLLLKKGNLLYIRGRSDEALEAFWQVTRIPPKDAEPYIAIGTLLCEREQYAEAARAYKQAIEYDSRRVDLYIEAISHFPREVWGDQHASEDALSILEHLHQYHPKNALIHLEIGKLLREAGRLPEAVTACKKAIECDPQSVDLYIEEVSHSYGFENAVSILEYLYQFHPRNSKIYLALSKWLLYGVDEYGVSKENNQYMARAVLAYKKAIEYDPQNVDLYIDKLQIFDRFLRRNRVLLSQNVISILEYLRQFHPKNARIYGCLGDTYREGFSYENAGFKIKAVEAYEQALRLHPHRANLIALSNTSSKSLVLPKEDQAFIEWQRELEKLRRALVPYYIQRIGGVLTGIIIVFAAIIADALLNWGGLGSANCGTGLAIFFIAIGILLSVFSLTNKWQLLGY